MKRREPLFITYLDMVLVLGDIMTVIVMPHRMNCGTTFNEIFDYIENCGIKFGGIWFQLVTDPEYLDPIYAPKFMKEKCIGDIDNFLNRPFLQDEKYNNILYGELKQSLIQTKGFLMENLDRTEHVNEFLKRMEILDRLRGQKLFDALPELRQLGG